MPRHNGPILTLADITNFGMSSTTEDKLADIFITANKMVPLYQSLIEIHWPQPLSLLQTGNSAAAGVTNNTIVSHQTKSMDMWCYWLRCHSAQDQFHFYQAPGGVNWG